MKVRCKLCWEEFDESEVKLHHIIPKCIGGTDKDKRAYLCKKCHAIWHYNLPKLLWEFVPDELKPNAIKAIRAKFLYISRQNARKKGMLDEWEKFFLD